MAKKVSDLLNRLTLNDNNQNQNIDDLINTSRNPNKTWNQMNCVKKSLQQIDLNSPIPDDKV